MLRFTTLLLTAVLVTGCASQQLANQEALSALANAKASELGSDSERALDQAQTAYKTAVEEELSFYAPITMQQLEAALKDAQEKELASKSAASIRASARVLTLLDNGLKNKHSARLLLAPLFTQKEVIDEIRAANVMRADYREAMDDLSDLIRLIEAGSSNKALEKSSAVLTDLNTLELNTMLALHWKPAADMLDKAEDEDADDNAPQVFALAEDKVEQAEIYIRQNYRDRVQSQATGIDALRAAQHSLFIGREAKRLQKLNSEAAEQAALKQEDLLHQIAATSGVGDIRYMAFRDQTLAIIQHIQEEQRAQANTAKPAAAQVKSAVPAQPKAQEKAAVNAVALPAGQPAEEPAAEESLTDDMPAAEVPAPAEQAPAEQAPAEQAPAEEMPADEMPADEMPAEEAPAEEAPAEEESLSE